MNLVNAICCLTLKWQKREREKYGKEKQQKNYEKR